MPPALQRFGNLLVLHLYNSTVMEWGADASAVSAPVHPRLLVVGVARSRFPSGFPEGLLQPLPLSLLSIQFCATDLTTLPDDLPMRWHPMAVVAFEKGIPTEFPASLLALQAFVSSLNGNQIETIPQMAAMPVGQILPEFTLDDNPLHELPPALGSPTNMFVRLGLQGTKLTVLPEWTQTQILLTAYMHDTPYCTNAEAISSQQRTVQCIERAPTDLNVHFPLERIDALYAFGQA
ncbi:hypothetical protein BBJ28_00020857 [Nothophytophthora sp. Chile5]|nr:hypothetical protein BBJ28_00020857 [Nothophytophthora sp. Chile5]